MKEIDKKLKEIDDILTRGVGEFIDPDGSFRKKLEAKIKGNYHSDIIIKLGADPTRPDLHLGHAVVFKKLKKLQDLGCKIVFIVGDFTTLLGDPTGKSKARPKADIVKDVDNTAPGIKSTQKNNIKEDQKGQYNAPYIPTSEQIQKNMETYINQIEQTKVLSIDKDKFSWIRNSDWFLGPTDMVYAKDAKAYIGFTLEDGRSSQINVDTSTFLGKSILFESTRMQKEIKPNELLTITLRGLLWTLQHITHSKLIERDMFKDRISNGEKLYMHEMLYPVIQGIDSYSICKIYGSCDLEVGGTDQTFNMLVGRDVMYANQQNPQSVLALDLLIGLDGKEKMSKSLDNYIGITDEPNKMYGKVMSIPDSLIEHYFELCTFTPIKQIKEISEKLKDESVNPKDIKMDLALQITSIYNGEEKAKEAQANWESTFSKKEIPEDVEEFVVNSTEKLIDVFVSHGTVSSKSDFRRLVDEGAISNLSTDEKITDSNSLVSNGTYRIGKKRFCKITVK